jgi:hypothetical protein
MVKMDASEASGRSITAMGSRDMVGPRGRSAVFRSTVPWNPFKLVIVILEVPDEGTWSVRLEWSTVTSKSWII